MIPSEIERRVGIGFYSTTSKGIEGRLRQRPDDFIVKEVLVNEMIAEPGGQYRIQRDTGGFLVCILEKRGLDTFTAIRRIAEKLKISENRIDFAGLKDAKALTYQFITIQRIRPSKIEGLRLDGVKLRSLYRSNRPITSEELVGNRFKISIRKIELQKKILRRRIDAIQTEILKEGGIPNFFGHQRFGTFRPITHIVGKSILIGDYRQAVLTYLLEPNLKEKPYLSKIRGELSDTMDFEKALGAFPRKLEYERILLSHLSRRPNDYINAIRKLPLGLRRLFIHAYQAYLFNRILNERVRCNLSLTEVETGDRVCELDPYGNPKGTPVEVDRKNTYRVGERIGKGRMGIVLPVFGFDTSTSDNEQGRIEKRIMEEERIQNEVFLVSAMPEMKAYGGHRTVIAKVRMIVKPDIREEPSNRTGLMVKVRFSLPKGSYATVVLREFMKADDPTIAMY
jgi:tRNA pseudouridine13 synthase